MFLLKSSFLQKCFEVADEGGKETVVANRKFINIVFILSGSVLSAVLGAAHGMRYMWIGMILSCILYGALLFFKKDLIWDFKGKKTEWKTETMVFVWTVSSVYLCVFSMAAHVKKAISPYLLEDTKDSLLYSVIAVLIIPYFYILYRKLAAKIKDNIPKIYRSFSEWERVFFWAHIVIMVLIILFIYQETSAFSYARFTDENGVVRDQTANAILNTDSSTLLKKSCNLAGMGDVRHPIWVMLQLPLASIAFILSKFFPGFWLAYPAISCILIDICLTFSIILLARLIENKWSIVIFGVSYPFLLYGLLFETSQIATCITLLAVYMICKGGEGEEDTSFFVAAASGYTLTSCVLALFVGRLRDGREYIKRIIKCGLKFLSLCVLWGQSYLVFHLWDEGMKMLSTYGGVNYTLRQRLIAFSHSMAATFVSVPYQNYKESREQYHYFSYYLTIWGKEAKIHWLGCVVILLALFGFCLNYRKRFARICFLWLVYHFVIFVVFGYSSGDYTVHVMLYSWAVVSLVIMAVSHILDKMKIKNKSLVWGILSALILCRNLEFLIEIYRYAVLRFPV